MVDAEVVKIIGRTGIYGEVMQVMCKVSDGDNKGRIIRRNVRTPVREGDIIDLTETEREAKPLT
ncbi:MAG: 30S ribosomal protein S28e [Candidatus Altiarchaeales archaeon]|nr:30S ribosomal protein S28e [Candidatus Altiarchaeales archaeon]MBD3415720.1 30S ribosomal protein S28e [Candidatus Altiarchaeales archaeon]